MCGLRCKAENRRNRRKTAAGHAVKVKWSIWSLETPVRTGFTCHINRNTVCDRCPCAHGKTGSVQRTRPVAEVHVDTSVYTTRWPSIIINYHVGIHTFNRTGSESSGFSGLYPSTGASFVQMINGAVRLRTYPCVRTYREIVQKHETENLRFPDCTVPRPYFLCLCQRRSENDS